MLPPASPKASRSQRVEIDISLSEVSAWLPRAMVASPTLHHLSDRRSLTAR